MSTIAFNVAAFRVQFPAYSNAGQYPDLTLQAYFDVASVIVDAEDNACYLLTGAARVQALNYLTAHVANLADIIAAGRAPGVVQSATIDKVSVSLTPPPDPSMFEFWLWQTGYGQFVVTILRAASAGGLWVGSGYSERSAFRKAGGLF